MANEFTVKLRILASAEGAAGQFARVAASAAGLRREFDRLGEGGRVSAGRIREGVDSISRQLEGMQRLARRAFFAVQGAGFAGDILRTAADFESLQASLKAVTGGSEAATRELAFLRELSDRLGVSLPETARAWLGFAAAARGTALEGERARQVFTAVAEAATVLGLSQEQLTGAFTALQQMMSKGVVSAEEMRGQLGERLFGAMQTAARAIGVTTEEFSAFLERGLIPADRFLPAFAEQLRREFGGGLADASATARAAMARFQNALTDLKLELAQSGLFDAAVEAIRAMTRAFKDPAFLDSVRTFGALLGDIVRLVVEHADKLAVLGGVIVGARTGAGIGRLAGPKGAAIGAGLGALAGGIGAFAALPEGEAQARTLEERVGALKRQIQSLEAGLDAQTGRARARAEAFLAEQRAKLAELEAQASATVASAATQAGAELRLDLARKAFADFTAQFRSDAEKLAVALAELKARARAAGIAETSEEFRRAEAALRARFARGGADELVRARLAAARAAAEGELAILRDGLARAQTAYEAAFEDRLVSIRGFYAAKTAIDQSQIDAEIARTRALLEEQRRLLASAAQEPERLRARGEVAKLEAELIVLNRRRADIEQASARAAAQAERALAEELVRVREELAALTGAGGAEERRAAIAREFRELTARLAAEGDAEGVSLVDRLIDVKAAQANLEALEAQWRLVTERMRNAQEAIEVQQQAGLLTEAQARRQIVELQQQSALEMERLLPAMEAAASALGPEAVERVRAFANELGRTKIVVDDLAVTINGQFQDAFAGLFESVISGAKSAREAFLDFGRSILATINRIIAQKFAEQLFEGFGSGMGGIGGAIADFFKGFKLFSGGGYVSGPGSSTSDSIPARLSDGEYVIRAAAVRQWGVAFFDAINGLAARPRLPHFAGGGLVAAAPGAAPPVVVQMTVQTPDAASFRRSQGQIAAEMRLALERAGRNL